MAVIEAVASSGAAAGAEARSPPGPEQIDVSVEPTVGLEEVAGGDANTPKRRVEEIKGGDDGPPMPPSMAPSDDKITTKLKQGRMVKADVNDHEGQPAPAMVTSAPREETVAPNLVNTLERSALQTDTTLLSGDDVDVSRIITRPVSSDRPPGPLPEQAQHHRSDVLIPDAYLVEEPVGVDSPADASNVVVGEPLLPWYKQSRIRIFLGMICLAMVALAITLGVSLSRPPEKTTTVVTVLASSAPSSSGMPTLAPSEMPSTSPSMSPVPTAFPTTLMQKLASNQKVASDGSNMVVVTREEYDWDDDGAYHLNVVFYEGAVQRDAFLVNYEGSGYSVFIEGNTTTIELLDDDCGGSIVYERDDAGSWSEIEDDRWCYEPPTAEASRWDDYTSSAHALALSLSVIVLPFLSLW